MKNELVKKDEVAGFIQQAIEKGLGVDVMERLFILHKEAKKERAKEAFIEARANFQKNCPVINKTKKVMNKDGRTIRYMYAPLESEIEQIKKLLADNGLSYSWNTENAENRMKVICNLTHIEGHTETSTFEIPIELSQYMTSPQSYASAQTFAKRYTLNNVLGVATAEEDNDSNSVEKEKDVKSQKAKVIFLLRKLEYKTDTKEEIEKAVKKVAQLELKDENLDEIISRLDISVQEKEQDIIKE
jgi:hypothetical protein